MKIAIDSRAAIWYRGTGMGTYTYQLLRNLYLVDKKNQYTFLLPNAQFQDLHPLHSGAFQSISQTQKTFWEQAVAERIEPAELEAAGQGPFQIYHIPHNGLGLPQKPLPTHCKLVVTIHDLIPYTMPETVGPAYLKLFRQEMPEILARADAVITVSEYSKQDLLRYTNVDPAKITVIAEGAESIYHPIPRQIAQNRLAIRYDLHQPFFLYLGGFSLRKNLRHILAGFAWLKQQDSAPLQLVVLGRDCPNQQLAKEWAKALQVEDDVKFCGFVPMRELPFFYNACLGFVYPSYYEGFGLPPLEAMACGAATIISNVTSLPEVAGDAALQVDPQDPINIGKAMQRLWQQESFRITLQQKGLARAKAFSWTKAAWQTHLLYERLGQDNG